MVRVISIGLACLFLVLSPVVGQVTEGDDGPLRLGRIEINGKVFFGMLSVGGVHVIDKDFFAEDARLSGTVHKLDTVKILSPLTPSKIILSKQNYSRKSKLVGKVLGYIERSDLAVLPTGAVITDSMPFKISGEMVIVIGQDIKNANKKAAGEAIVGVTIGARIYTRVDGGDGRTDDDKLSNIALGPWLVPGLSHNRLELSVKMNGKRKRIFSTRKMTFSAEEIVSQVSRKFELKTGDVIFTGYRGHLIAISDQAKIEIYLEGVGALRLQAGNRK